MPEPGDDEVLVRVTAASVNPIDWKLRDSATRPLPFVIGQDFAGVVSATGKNVREYVQGERIFGIARKHGAYAQYTLVPAHSTDEPIAHIPDGVGDADAASLPTAGLTALASLDALPVGSGTTVVILGATGGVGLFAVQLAKARGARVIGTGHSRHQAQAASFGIDDYIAYDRQAVADAIQERLPRGADAILDLVDDATTIGSLQRALHPGGTIVSTIGALDVDALSGKGFHATNLVMNQTAASSHEGLRTLARMVEDGTLRVIIAQERDLRDAVQLLDESKGGHVTGKLVVTVETGRI